MSPDLRELAVYAAALASEYERGRRDALEEVAKDPPPAKERERMPAADTEVAGRLRAIYTAVSSGRQRPLSVPEQVAIKEAADTIDRLTATLAAPPSEIPREPTPEMLHAYEQEWHRVAQERGYIVAVGPVTTWRVMYDAAPKSAVSDPPPAKGGG